jgi:hypothetical protein
LVRDMDRIDHVIYRPQKKKNSRTKWRKKEENKLVAVSEWKEEREQKIDNNAHTHTL